VVTHAPRTVPRLAPPQRAQGTAGVRGTLAAGALVIVALWWHDPTQLRGPGATVTSLGRLSGLLGAYAVLVQVLLLARLPWFERAVGFDRLTAWHRAAGTNIVILLGAHVLLIVEGYALAAQRGAVPTAWRVISTYPDMIKALLGMGLFALVAVTSARAVRARVSYEAWWLLHLGAYAAVALAFSHQTSSGADFVGHPVNRLLWRAMYVAVGGCLLTWRVVLPLRAWSTHRLIVERVVPEGPGVVSVWVRGRHLEQMGAQSGQFLLWRFLSRGHLWTAHPYSLSAAPDGRHLRITVKASGDHSADLGRLRPGTPVLTEGPFGHFTAGSSTRRRSLLIAGGVGIGPVRALAETLARTAAPGDVVLLYRASREEDLVLRGELAQLTAAYGVRVQHLIGRRAELAEDPLGAPMLMRLVPDLLNRDAFVCGPDGMTMAVLETLRDLGMRPSQLHAESFSLR